MSSPISIQYSLGDIKFHAVMSESHNASTQVTSYPTQVGFNISDHAIRKNRGVVLEGIVTNTLLKGQSQPTYSSNNSKKMFEVLESLVQSAEPCTVNTNLGKYEPVIFTSFETTQKEGVMDSIKFKVTGTEVQIANSVNKSTPIVLVMSEVTGSEKVNFEKILSSSGVVVDKNKKMYKGSMKENEDFTVEVRDSSGKEQKVTYRKEGEHHTIHSTGQKTYTENNKVTKITEVDGDESTTTTYNEEGRITNITTGTKESYNTQFGLSLVTNYGFIIGKSSVGQGIRELHTGDSNDNLYSIKDSKKKYLKGVDPSSEQKRLDGLVEDLRPKEKTETTIIKVEGEAGPLSNLTNLQRRV